MNIQLDEEGSQLFDCSMAAGEGGVTGNWGVPAHMSDSSMGQLSLPSASAGPWLSFFLSWTTMTLLFLLSCSFFWYTMTHHAHIWFKDNFLSHQVWKLKSRRRENRNFRHDSKFQDLLSEVNSEWPRSPAWNTMKIIDAFNIKIESLYSPAGSNLKETLRPTLL